MKTYALTTTTAQRRAIFQNTQNVELLLETLFHYRNQSRYQLHGFAIMPEHIHVLLTPSIGQTIERCAPCIKGGFSHRMPKDHRLNIWQPSFHHHRIREEQDFHNQLTYIAQNPERRSLRDHSYIHTRWLHQIDPIPQHLRTL